MKIVEIRMSVYVPDEVLSKGDESVLDYLNDKLYMDPEFYGIIESDSITINNTHYEED
tara:strand:- start:211 stop:384 length:174 start_codon:yes stop_codon:yes gene_type:complete